MRSDWDGPWIKPRVTFGRSSGSIAVNRLPWRRYGPCSKRETYLLRYWTERSNAMPRVSSINGPELLRGRKWYNLLCKDNVNNGMKLLIVDSLTKMRRSVYGSQQLMILLMSKFAMKWMVRQ